MSPSARERNKKGEAKVVDQNEKAENEFLMLRVYTAIRPSINQHADLKTRNEWAPGPRESATLQRKILERDRLAKKEPRQTRTYFHSHKRERGGRYFNGIVSRYKENVRTYGEGWCTPCAGLRRITPVSLYFYLGPHPRLYLLPMRNYPALVIRTTVR